MAEALLKCPQLRLVHVPTYSVESMGSGASAETTENEEIVAIPQYSDEMPAYRSDGTRLPPNPPDPASNKACLEPYRQASMAIFRLIRDWCTSLGDGILLEKGGLDEAFIDITEEVEQQLIDDFDQKYTMLRDELADVGDEELEVEAVENLKLYDTKWIDEELDFTGLGENAITNENICKEEEEEIVEKMRKSLGKLRIWKGAQLSKHLRSRLRSELNFIASVGIASNKMLAKLVSALYKPDKQTRIEPAHVEIFMTRVPFEKIRMMGGKMGRSVLKGNSEGTGDESDTDGEESDPETSDNYAPTTSVIMASELWPLSISELAERVGDRNTATWIHQLIRGLDPSPVTPRSLTKSFMSAKSFRPSVRDWPELHDWVVVLVGELWSRIAEERESSGRWPATITIQYKSFTKQQSQNTWNNTGAVSKSCEFPYASTIPSQATRPDFLSAVFKILSSHSPALFPMSRLAVSVSNFKSLEADGKARATRVDQFFKKKHTESNLENDPISANSSFDLPGLDRFFPEKPEKSTVTSVAVKGPVAKKSVLELLAASTKQRDPLAASFVDSAPKKSRRSSDSSNGILKFFKSAQPQNSASLFNCTELNCKFSCSLDDAKSIQEHCDHHFAIKLSRH